MKVCAVEKSAELITVDLTLKTLKSTEEISANC